MNIKIKPSKKVGGKVKVLSSKSHLHRIILLSAFASSPSKIYYHGKLSKDVLATLSCIESVGAKAEITEKSIKIIPANPVKESAKVFCNESGSTLRFILPIFTALGINLEISVAGRLANRPLNPLNEILTANGVSLSKEYPLKVNGKFSVRKVEIPANVSSQFISGVLMAFAVNGKGGVVKVTGDFQSKPYVDLTVHCIKQFGVKVIENENEYTVIPKTYRGKRIKAEGDWSNAAFFMSLGAIKGKVKVKGVQKFSVQGDKAICQILKEMGAKVKQTKNSVIVESDKLIATTINAKNIPDLIPVLSAVASVSKGETQVINAERLRIKESDRIESVKNFITSLGGVVNSTQGEITIKGAKLSGGRVDGANDHRIVMSSAILSVACESPVIINGSEAVNKSYPQFFEEMKKLGFIVEEE